MDPNASQWIYGALADTRLRILKFSGDNDLVVSTMGTEMWISQMDWPINREWEQYFTPDK